MADYWVHPVLRFTSFFSFLSSKVITNATSTESLMALPVVAMKKWLVCGVMTASPSTFWWHHEIVAATVHLKVARVQAALCPSVVVNFSSVL